MGMGSTAPCRPPGCPSWEKLGAKRLEPSMARLGREETPEGQTRYGGRAGCVRWRNWRRGFEDHRERHHWRACCVRTCAVRQSDTIGVEFRKPPEVYTAMHFHVVDKIVFYPAGCPLSAFHHDLFHGLASR